MNEHAIITGESGAVPSAPCRSALVGQLAPGFAHEINTPAQYIGDNLRFLRDAFEQFAQRMPAAPSDSELDYLLAEVPAAIDQSLEGARQIARVTGALRSFAAGSVGMVRPVNLNAAIEDALILARTEWKSVTMPERNLDGALPLVSCAEVEVKQVVLELIVSAARAMNACRSAALDGAGRILITSRSSDNDVEMSISDSGVPVSSPARQAVLTRVHRIVRDTLDGELRATLDADGMNRVVVRLPLVCTESSVGADVSAGATLRERTMQEVDSR